MEQRGVGARSSRAIRMSIAVNYHAGQENIASACLLCAGRIVRVEVLDDMAAAGVGLKQASAEALPFRDRWFERAVTWLSVHLWDRPRGFAEVRRVADAWVIATFEPGHFHRFYLNRFFPSIERVDLARFPDGPTLERELREAGFEDVRLIPFSQRAEISRDTALAKIEGRHISTFDLLDEDELRAGTERARRELPERVEYGLEWFVAVAR